jgi:hypothetical protein
MSEVQKFGRRFCRRRYYFVSCPVQLGLKIVSLTKMFNDATMKKIICFIFMITVVQYLYSNILQFVYCSYQTYTVQC